MDSRASCIARPYCYCSYRTQHLNSRGSVIYSPKRYDRNCAKRMKGKKDKEQREAAKELEHSIHIVKAPAALNKDLSLIPPAKVPVTEKQSEENRMEE
ncbi:hypothetical protein BC332_26818 [Capsicum chinense]|nr:hypothetical protein BC332_26818 [Capsicum chinense]